MLDKKRQDIFDELQHIEERMKKNFERKPKDDKLDANVENNDDETDAQIKTDVIHVEMDVKNVVDLSLNVEPDETNLNNNMETEIKSPPIQDSSDDLKDIMDVTEEIKASSEMEI